MKPDSNRPLLAYCLASLGDFYDSWQGIALLARSDVLARKLQVNVYGRVKVELLNQAEGLKGLCGGSHKLHSTPNLEYIS